ncbi:MAG: shikimate dehydrogenase [Verrucomicrobiaceae bacterium]|nr:shikimate dehydrogenase [Verrucomicrobiaceae bacterium]
MSNDVYTLADLRQWHAQPPTWAEGEKPILAVFGDPVAHSLSPQMMNPALKAIGVAGRYVRLHILEDEFSEAVRLLPKLGFVGTNVTIPHKFNALQNVDEVDSLAQRLGAVNTVVVQEDQLLGFNSDGPGFLRSLTEAFHVDAKDLRILILGSGGGAGRAVAIQCALVKCERLVLVNRTAAKAQVVADEVRPLFQDDHLAGPMERLEAVAWEDDALAHQLDHTDLIINATSAGMKLTDPDLLSNGLIQPHHLIYDMVYKPARTRFIASAEAAGARATNGLSMLLHQGVISFETWFNRPAPIDVMREALQKAAAEAS